MKKYVFVFTVLMVLISCAQPKKKNDVALKTEPQSYKIEKAVKGEENPLKNPDLLPKRKKK